ncbi:acyl-CoA dehydrogenase family protein, partial [uncultured Pseudacidovorax sp.]|uniref:acyl-CoA dehydrogenase family protein n=1 Tax=uncultured Pseudacidovorax sp. TaxID=679313 RepID=UPI0025F9DCDA
LPEVWAQLAELGWLALAVPEDLGGFGGRAADLCAVAEPLGVAGLNEPFAESGVRPPALLAALPDPNDAVARLLVGAMAGELRLACIAGGAACDWAACQDGRITGRSPVVPGGAGANAWLWASVEEGQVTLFALTRHLPGLQAQACTLVDGQRAVRLSAQSLTLPEPLWQGSTDAWRAAVARAEALTLLTHCAMSVGAMRRARTLTQDYLSTRRQFGQTVVRNQVIQHRLVDLMVEIEEADALVQATAERTDAGIGDPRWLAATGATLAAATRHVWQETVQLHGAIGITQECEAAPLVRRLALAGVQHGTEAHHLARLADASLGPMPPHAAD